MNLLLHKGGCGALLLSSMFAIAQTTVLPSSLAWWAQTARQRGQSSIVIGASETHDYTPTLAEIVRQDLVLRGTVLEYTTDASDGFKIRQFYRVQVLDKGPDKRPPAMPVISVRPPSHFRTASSDEFILYTDGGTAVVDEITVTQSGPPTLEVRKTYLFFLSLSSNGIYTLVTYTKPLLLDAQGNIDFTTAGTSKFVTQLRSAHCYSVKEIIDQCAKVMN